MRIFLIVLLLTGLFLSVAAFAAPYGPLVAGTAAGGASSAKLSMDNTLGLHYPFGASDGGGYPSLPGSHPTNNTVAYDEMRDPARVAGHRTPMSAEIWIVASKRRDGPENKLPSEILVSYLGHRGHEVAATAPPTK